MGRTILIVATLALAAAALGGVWQNSHYLKVRRKAAQDHQPLIYAGEAFQALTFLKVQPGADPIAAVRAFRAATESLGGGRWVYAGKVVINVPSAQIGPVDWSAVVLAQYPSRQAYERAAADPAYAAALAQFPAHYVHGARRAWAANLLLPQVLLVRKVIRAATFARSDYPFTPMAPDKLPAPVKRVMSRLRAETDLGRDAAVVVNLQKRGDASKQASDARYVKAMTDLMAERGYGPLHRAKAVALPGSQDFDAMAIVYYPSTFFFADMMGSTFYQRILPEKQLGDNQSTITVPILDRL